MFWLRNKKIIFLVHLSGGLSLFSDKCYFFQPLYESQNLKSHNRFSSSSGTSQGSGDPVFFNKAPPGGQQPGMSSISNNLTELDQLLSDLNSAQFLAEVDKKHPSGSIIVLKGLSVYPCSIIFLLTARIVLLFDLQELFSY